MNRPEAPQPTRHTRTATLALAALTLAAPLAAQTTAPASVPSLLRQHGIRAIDPPSPASDFTLPNLAGGESSLSDFYGSWVVLTFFATWCGPCRSELPTLEKLHRERSGQGVTVLGVSVDDAQAPLGSFVRELRLSFPILWDQTKKVGAAYRASSIPVSYLVDPEGRLVGVSRGSRDWSALTAMMDDALAAVPATLTVEPNRDAYADASEPVATATISDPPTAEVALETGTPVAGKPFYLDIKLRWAGNFEEYLPHPPEVLLPEGVAQQSVTAETSSRDGRKELTYRVTLVAAKPGKYALDPVEVRYTPRLEQTPVAGRVGGPTVEVVPRTVLGLPPGVVSAGAAVLVLVGLVGSLAGRRLRRRRRGHRAAPEKELYDTLRAEHEAARKKRLQGDGAGYLLALAALDEKIRRARHEPEPDEAARSALQDAVERARYGGEAPPAAELDRLQRKIERRLEDLRPDLEKDERESLKLKQEEA